jgi:hypothetical protein
MNTSNEPYKPELDTIIFEDSYEPTGLRVSVHRYGHSGENKIKIGPRVKIGNGGTEVFNRVVRLSTLEFKWAYTVLQPYL